ncbi:MarR family transcriptional regulator [Sphingomonas koreensis]|nr:MarR family transcriptional regulator [Sphingomonas koreensis]
MPRQLVEHSIAAATRRTAQSDDRRTALAQWILAGRRRRVFLLPDVAFGDASWDLILDLYLVARRGGRVDVSGLCVASGAPPTTALRHLDRLVAKQLVRRLPDPYDRRRFHVEISPSLAAALDDWLDAQLAALAGWERSAGTANA